MFLKTRGPTLEDLPRIHKDALETASWLTASFRKQYQRGAVDVRPQRVIRVLHKAGIRVVLMGTLALNTYRDQARATQDVDVLVRRKDVANAIEVLEKTFPTLEIEHTASVARFMDPVIRKPIIDLMKPTIAVYRLVFGQTMVVANTHEIPNLEMVLVCKFAAMASPNRRMARKYLDAADFLNVVDYNKDTLDLIKLRSLAEKVDPLVARKMMKMIRDFHHGRRITLP